MFEIKSKRKFRVKPKDFLYYKTSSHCNHRNNPWWGHCPDCINVIDTSEFISEKSVIETDKLTYSKLKGVYYKNMFITVEYLDVIEEIRH